MELTKEQKSFKENKIKEWSNDLQQLEMNLEIFRLAKTHVVKKLETGFYLREAENQINITKEQIATLSRNLKALQIQLKEKKDGN